MVAQTREEAREVNESVRAQLHAAGQLGPGQKLATFYPVDLSEAQKRDPRFYQPGQHACFLQRYGRYAKGEVCPIVGTTARGVVMVKDGRRSTVSYRYARRLVVVAQTEMEIAPGDRLQIKANGESKDGRKFTNGELVTVRHVRKNGTLVVVGDQDVTKTLAPSQRLFVRGYAVTSYGSQGKTVDTVLLADAACRAATNRNQWYVAISRGRKRVIVFTADKAELRAVIGQSGDRRLALEMKPLATALSLRQEPRERIPEWTRRSLEAAERVREHEAVLHLSERPAVRRSITL